MKKIILGTVLLTSFLTSEAFARVTFSKIPLEKAWGLVCTMVDRNGRGLSEYQITTFSMNKKPLFRIKFADSTLGDNWANIGLTSVETAEGGGNDLIEYSGIILKGATGAMFSGSKELSITVDLMSPLAGAPNTYKSKMLLDKNKNAKVPAWANKRELFCTLVPQ